jgi:hypothetical protein
MGGLRFVIAGAALLVSGAVSLPLSAQQNESSQQYRFAGNPAAAAPLLDCALTPFSPGTPCDVTLLQGQDSLPFSVRLNLISRPTGPADTVRVTVGASRCCVQPQVAIMDPNGFVSVIWRASKQSGDPVQISFAVMDGTLRQADVVLRPTVPDPTPRPLVLAPDGNPYVWVRGDRIPRQIPVVIQSVGGTLDRESCESVKVLFRARMEAKADPDSTHPSWVQTENGTACIAYTRWKLADDAGAQDLDVIAGGNGTITRERMTIRAFSRQTPRLTAGYGYFSNLKYDEEVRCEDARSLPDCEGAADSVEVTRTSREGRGAPFFALEMPLFLSTRPTNWLTRGLYQRTRLTVGTTFDRSEDNIFVGVTVLPLLFAASEASPFQINAGLMVNGGKPYGGISLDAAAIVTPILTAVGIPGL